MSPGIRYCQSPGCDRPATTALIAPLNGARISLTGHVAPVATQRVQYACDNHIETIEQNWSII